MTDVTVLASQFLANVRKVRNEKEVTKFINVTIGELRHNGFTEEELQHLIRYVYSQLHAIDPVTVNDSQEWNTIVHAKVELFRWTSRKD